MKFTKEQKELLEVLPNGVEVINTLSDSQKLILAQIVLMYGTDYAADYQHVYRTNEMLMEDTGIKSNKTIITSVRVLEEKGLIERVSGKRKFASTYTLTDYYFEVSGHKRPEKKGCNLGCNFEDKCKNIDIMGVIETMQQEINELKKQVEELKGVIYSVKKGVKVEDYTENYTTDTDTDKEKDEIIHDCILHVPEQSVNSIEDDYEEILNNVDYEEVERVQAAYLQDPNPSSSFKERNEWATRCYEELEATIQVLFKCWDANMVIAYADKVNSILDKVDEHINEGWFTQAQISKFDTITNNFNSIIRKKAELIGQHDSSVQVTEQSAESNEQYSSIENKNNMGGCAAPKQITFNPKHFILVGERVIEMINEGREQRSIDNYSFNEFSNEYGSEWVGSQVHPYYQLTTNAIWNGKVDALENKVNQLKECA